MLRRFTIKPPSAVLLLNATSSANFNKSSSLFPILQSHSASDYGFPVLVTKTHNISSSFTSSCFLAPTPVLLKPSLTRNSSQNKKKKKTASISKKIMDSTSSISPSCSVEWMKELRSDASWIVELDGKYVSITIEFDEYLKPETTEIPSFAVIHFCQYLKYFVEEKYSHSKFHAAVARDGFVWISKFVHNAEFVRKWTWHVRRVIEDNEAANRMIFGTEQVRDAFVGISEFATSYGALQQWCAAVECLVQDNEFNQKLFGTTEILKCFVSLSKGMKWTCCCDGWIGALANITKLKENQQLFGTVEFRNTMIRVADFIGFEEERNNWLQILDNVTDNNASNKKLFLVGALKDEKERIEKIKF